MYPACKQSYGISLDRHRADESAPTPVSPPRGILALVLMSVHPKLAHLVHRDFQPLYRETGSGGNCHSQHGVAYNLDERRSSFWGPQGVPPPLRLHLRRNLITWCLLGPFSDSSASIKRQEDSHFFAPFRRAASSLSRIAACRARCCTRFSSAVIRGTMSSNGFSRIRTLLTLGGLHGK
jgi:hypothetical protein